MTKAFENGTGGLVLIGTSNPSAASSVSFTNLTVGKRYRILSSTIGSSGGVELHLKFRENSTDKTTGYYGAGWGVFYNTGGGEGYTLNNNSKVWLLTLATTKYNIASLDFYIPTAAQAYVVGQVWDENTSKSWYISGSNIAMSSVNGFSILPASGTITGTIKLYEYR